MELVLPGCPKKLNEAKELNRVPNRSTEISLQIPAVRLDPQGTKLRYFIGSSTGTIAQGILIPGDENKWSQDIIDLNAKNGVPTIIQCGHVYTKNLLGKKRHLRKSGHVNPHPLDVGETILVTSFAWVEKLPSYKLENPALIPKIVQSENLLLTQAVAITYTTEALRTALPTGEIIPTLAAGFEVHIEPCTVAKTSDHVIKRSHPKTGEIMYYQSISIDVASPTFPDGIRINDRRIIPDITTLPKKGSVLALHLVKIAKGVTTRIGQELYAPKLNYPMGKPVEEPTTVVEYFHYPTNEFEAAVRSHKSDWHEQSYEKASTLNKPATI